MSNTLSSEEFSIRAAAVLGGRGWMLRLSQSIGVHYATVKRWASGDLTVPEYAVSVIELLEVVPAAMRPKRFL